MRYDDVLEVDDFKGNKILRIPVGFNQSMAFGFNKAIIFVSHEQDLRDFVKSDGKSVSNNKLTISEYKGNAILEIPSGRAKYPIRFGLSKARALIENMEYIMQFAEDLESEQIEKEYGVSKEQQLADKAEHVPF